MCWTPLLLIPRLLSPDDGKNVSLHAVKWKSSTLAWASIRQGFLKAVVENSAMPINQHSIYVLVKLFTVVFSVFHMPTTAMSGLA